MMKVFAIGLPTLYLLGTVAFGTLYLSRGGEDLIAAIAFGALAHLHLYFYWLSENPGAEREPGG